MLTRSVASGVCDWYAVRAQTQAQTWDVRSLSESEYLYL